MSSSPASKLLTLCAALCLVTHPAAAEKLKSKSFKKLGTSMGVVIVDANWGRTWGCGGYDNAQLTDMKFELVSPSDKNADKKHSEIVLEAPSRLFVNEEFSTYGFIVEPGDYALTEFRIKVARSHNEVGYLQAERSDLVEGDVYSGGLLNVGAGEVVYVGHFGLDCTMSPMPWRYYLQGDDAFDEYLAALRKKFKFLKGVDVDYRLFATTNFGEDFNFAAGGQYELDGDYTAARDSFAKALESARSSGQAPTYVSAVLYNLGRMEALTCDFDSGEQLLMEALTMERGLDSPGPANITKRLSELARLSSTQGKFEQSASYYDEAIPLLEQLNIEDIDPVGFADFLDGYSAVLSQLERSEAASVTARASGLRSENEGKAAQVAPVEYHEVCEGETADGPR